MERRVKYARYAVCAYVCAGAFALTGMLSGMFVAVACMGAGAVFSTLSERK